MTKIRMGTDVVQKRRIRHNHTGREKERKKGAAHQEKRGGRDPTEKPPCLQPQDAIALFGKRRHRGGHEHEE